MAFDIQGAKDAGYSDDEIIDYMSKDNGFDIAGARNAGYTTSEIYEHLTQTAKPKSRTWSEALADGGRSAAASVNNTLKTVTDLAGVDNPVSRTLKESADSWSASYSPAYKQELEKQKTEKAALGDNASYIDRAALAAKQVIRNPIESTGELIGNIAPMAIGGMAGLGTKGMIALSTAMGGGAVKGGIAETIENAPEEALLQDPLYKELRTGGKTEAEAKSILAVERSSYGEAYGKILTGAGIGAAVGKFGSVESALANLGKNKIAKGVGDGAIKATAKGVGKEVATEIPQEMTETYLGNTGAAEKGAKIAPDQGVIEAGVKAGILSAVGGAGAGFSESRGVAPKPTPKDIISPTVTTVDDAIKTAEAAVSDKAASNIGDILKTAETQTADAALIQQLNEATTENVATKTDSVASNTETVAQPTVNENIDNLIAAYQAKPNDAESVASEIQPTPEATNAIASKTEPNVPANVDTVVASDSVSNSNVGSEIPANIGATVPNDAAIAPVVPEAQNVATQTQQAAQPTTQAIEQTPTAKPIDQRLIPVSKRVVQTEVTPIDNQLTEVQKSQINEANAQQFESLYQQDVKESIAQRLGRTVDATKTKRGMTPFKLFLREHGISPSVASDVTGESGLKANNKLPATFRRNGLNLDLLAERALEAGFMSQGEFDSENDNGGVNRLVEMIQAEISGNQQVRVAETSDTYEAQAERVQRAEIEGMADAIGLPYKGDISTDVLASMVRRITNRVDYEGKKQSGEIKTGKLKEERVLEAAKQFASKIEQKRLQYERELNEFAEATIAEQDALFDLQYNEDGTPILTKVSDLNAVSAWLEENEENNNDYGTITEAERNTGENQAPSSGITKESVTDGDTGSTQAQPRSVAEEGLTAPTRAGVLAQQDQKEQEAQRQKDGGDKAIERKVTADQVDLFNPQSSIFDAQKQTVSSDTIADDATKNVANKPASEMSASDLLRLAADKMDESAKPANQGVESIKETSARVFEGMTANQHTSEAKRIRDAAETMRQRGMTDVASNYDKLAENHEIAAEKKAKSSSAKIEDSGEVLEGARKLYAKAYAAKLDEGMGMDIASVPLSKSWPEPDYQRMIDDGADPWAVAFAHAARDEIPTKPIKSWKLNGWVNQVSLLRDVTSKVISGDITKDKVIHQINLRNSDALPNWINKVDLYKVVGHDFPLKNITFRPYKGEVTDENTVWVVEKDYFGNKVAYGETKDATIAEFKKWADTQKAKNTETDKSTKFDIYSYKSKKGWFIGKLLGKGKAIDLMNFESVKEAREYLAQNKPELEKLLAEAKEIPNERREINAPRVGVDHRNGADVTSDQFRETFGFRGEQFGASMPQAERQANMNQAYDALMDLAGVIGVPPKALSLNGELGLAFGARGTGGKNAFAAHYEADTTGEVTPNRVVINLTRKNGAGSLAHEWFHAVDNYFARMQGQKAGFMTERVTDDTRVREEMKEAFKELRKTINLTGIKARSQVLDNKRTKAYWTTGLEMAARSFESYVIAKLEDQGASNDYLANIVNETLYALQGAYPYPSMGEMPAIRAAFDNFFNVVQTKETDTGVAMFSRAQTETPAFKAWFGDSKVVDAEGKPLVVYHGTGADFNTFEGGAFFTDDYYNADGYASGERVIEAFISLKNPLIIDAKGKKWNELKNKQGSSTREIISKLDIKKNDGVIFKNIKDSWIDDEDAQDAGTVYFVASPTQIKSATGNNGNFDASNPDIRYSQGKNNGGLPASKVQSIVDTLKSKWAAAPDIVVATTMDDAAIPQKVRDYNDAQLSQGATGAPEGFFYGGKVYLIADQLPTAKDVHRVLFHETLGHVGLRGAFGESLTPILKQISVMRKAEVTAKAKEYGLDMAKESDRLQAAEEVLAVLAQTKPEMGFVKRAIAAIRTWLRAHGVNLQLSDGDIVANYILPARAFVEGGKGATAGDTAFSRQSQTPAFKAWFGDSKVVDSEGKPLVVYHSTSEQFTVFDKEKIGSANSSTVLQGFYFADRPLRDADKEMAVYLSLKNPIVIDVKKSDFDTIGAQEAIQHFIQNGTETYLREYLENYRDMSDDEISEQMMEWRGADGAILKNTSYDVHSDEFIVFNPAQIKSATGNNGEFDASNSDIRFARKMVGETDREYTPEQLKAMENVGFKVETSTLADRAKHLQKDFWKKLAQNVADQFAPVKDIDEAAYRLLRLSKGASGAFETFLHGGKLKIEDGVYNFDEANRGGVIEELLIPLEGEHHDFMRWIAANRAERLKVAGKENLFSDQDIAAIKTLADGKTKFDYVLQHGTNAGQTTRDRTLIYADSLKTFNEFNKNILDMAEQSGLIDGGSRVLWENEFYVPFYRVADDSDGGIRGMNIKGGAVRQTAFKTLKGGKNALNADLLDNTLMNWAHLLDASAKNRAAKATIEAAESIGAAVAGDQKQLAALATTLRNKNGVVWFMDKGQKRYSLINADDGSYLFDAITALEYAGIKNPVMNAMSSMKHALTIGVTASPFFKIRNLIRDSVQVIATSGISANPIKNVAQGFGLTKNGSDAYFKLLAGGGTIHFGTMFEGSEAKRVQSLVEMGIDKETILDNPQKLKAFYHKVIKPSWDAYNELGNRGEAVNRAALYDQLIKQGKTHAEASYQARDLMDFSMQGTSTAVRFLTQVVPFFNARIQGMYKLGRGVKEDPKRFALVLGATAAVSLGLLAAYHDDEDWKKREEWDRNNFWWFKINGVAYRIPKPFEIGAIATLAERGFEYAFDNEMTGKRLMKQVSNLLMDNLSMNPIPQLFKPVLDIYSNKDSFTGNQIESDSAEKLQSEYRYTSKTSMTSRAISTGLNAVTGVIDKEALSPVQVEHLLRGYFGWLGSFVVGAADIVARPATNQPEKPSSDLWKWATGGMISNLDDAPSRYVSQMYDQAKEIEQAYSTYRNLQKQGKEEEADKFAEKNVDKLNKYRSVERVKKSASRINEQIRIIERSALDSVEKREKIRELNRAKERMAMAVN